MEGRALRVLLADRRRPPGICFTLVAYFLQCPLESPGDGCRALASFTGGWLTATSSYLGTRPGSPPLSSSRTFRHPGRKPVALSSPAGPPAQHSGTHVPLWTPLSWVSAVTGHTPWPVRPAPPEHEVLRSLHVAAVTWLLLWPGTLQWMGHRLCPCSHPWTHFGSRGWSCQGVFSGASVRTRAPCDS